MKTMHELILNIILLSSSLSSVQLAHSQTPQDNPFVYSAGLLAGRGGVQGGGGDLGTEAKIKHIRDELLRWIKDSGAKDLKFDQISYTEYLVGNEQKGLFGMTEVLQPGAVVISVFNSDEERLEDFEQNTYVDGRPKVCKGFISEQDERPYINCSREKFEALTLPEQYQQVHHEFASLAGLERNIGADSDYSISKQIMSYLDKERLTVKKQHSEPKEAKVCKGYIEEDDAGYSYAVYACGQLNSNSISNPTINRNLFFNHSKMPSMVCKAFGFKTSIDVKVFDLAKARKEKRRELRHCKRDPVCRSKLKESLNDKEMEQKKQDKSSVERQLDAMLSWPLSSFYNGSYIVSSSQGSCKDQGLPRSCETGIVTEVTCR